MIFVSSLNCAPFIQCVQSKITLVWSVPVFLCAPFIQCVQSKITLVWSVPVFLWTSVNYPVGSHLLLPPWHDHNHRYNFGTTMALHSRFGWGYNGSTELVMMRASSAISLVIMTSAILPSNSALSWIKRVVHISSSLFEVMDLIVPKSYSFDCDRLIQAIPDFLDSRKDRVDSHDFSVVKFSCTKAANDPSNFIGLSRPLRISEIWIPEFTPMIGRPSSGASILWENSFPLIFLLGGWLIAVDFPPLLGSSASASSNARGLN